MKNSIVILRLPVALFFLAMSPFFFFTFVVLAFHAGIMDLTAVLDSDQFIWLIIDGFKLAGSFAAVSFFALFFEE